MIQNKDSQNNKNNFDSLAGRIKQRLEKLGKSERKASLEAGLSDSFLRNIREGKSLSPRIDTLEKIAVVLQTTAQWLMNGEGNAEFLHQNAHLDPSSGIYNDNGNDLAESANGMIVKGLKFGTRRLPVFGQAVGGVDGDFPMNGTVLFDVLCPPQLEDVEDAYAIMISGDSMYPRYEDGELAFIDPNRRVKKGDYVVAQVIIKNDTTPHAFIKKFLRHNAQELVLEQFNPMKELSFPHANVVSVHFIALAGVIS
ncbi:helix-turn-helix transcriptional regulator [Bartonella sp. HY038]|uniref:XRE family transcriptional regulator n=1 Tax=Bartonella sp. HY038 TaxID=2759660 RepID=UPI001FEE0971|nr:helix-turn-helix transcriptional regulator [Bartonella sp. HY038]